MAPDRQFCYCWVDFQIAKVRRKKYASPHLVYLRRLPRGMCGQGAHSYASIDHVESRARYCRLDHWGAVTHLFYPPSAGGKFHLGGLIVSIVGAILVLYVWQKFRLQLPRG
jgi:hypothetical protein